MRPADRGLADLPLRGQLLHDRDAVHPVRHRGRLPVPGGRDPRGGELGLRPGRDRDLRRPAAGRARLRVATGSARLEIRREKLRALSPLEEPRSPAELRVRQLRARDLLRGDLEGAALERHVDRVGVDDHARQGDALGARQLDLPGHLRARLLRDRDDVDRQPALRHRAVRRREHARLAPAGRHADPLGPGGDQDGPGHPPPLRPDAGAEVGDRDGRLLVLGRHVRELRRGPGGGQVHAGRHPRPRLPAAPGGAPVRVQQAAADDPRQPRSRLAAPLQRDRHRGVGPARDRHGVQGGGRGVRRRPGAVGRPPRRAGRGKRLMPDAPGLELIAQDLNQTAAGLGARHLPRARAGVPDRRPGANPRPCSAGCATPRARSTASWPASTASTTCRPSRASASSTSC